jgi:ABC-type nitrate/sulfonate/bicarbonate transport system permease component
LTRRITGIAWELLLPATLVTLWWVLTVRTDSMFYPPLPEVLATFADTWFGAGFAQHVLPSLRNLALGYTLGTAVGIAAGVMLGLAPALHRALSPLLEYARALPPPAILPFAILLLGVGPGMKVGVIVLSVVFPVLMNTVDGVRGVEPTMRDMAKVYRLPWSYRLRYVLLPSAAPQILAGARTSLSLGVLLMVVSEMVASTSGIGFFTLQAQRGFAFTEMWAGMLLLGLLGYLLNLAFGLVERRVLHWQIGAARAAAGA